MKKLFYTLFLALFALNFVSAQQYTTYYAFSKTSGFDLTTTENFTYLSTSIYNIYVFEHTNAITITVKNGSREMPIDLGAEDATYIDTKKQQNPIFYDFYILTDFEGDISDKVTPEDPYYIENFTLVNSIGKYKQYKSRFNTSIFGSSIYIQSPNSTWFFAQEVNYNGKIMFYDKQTEELSVVGELEYKNNQFPPIQDAFFSKITYTAENYNIDYFQWVSCPYDAELTVHVGTTKAIYTYDGNLADDGTEPAFVLMRYENDKEIPWVDNGSATLERGVGYILGIDRRTASGQVVATYESINDINVHKYGAHIFHTNDKEIWDYMNQFAEFNRYTNSPMATYKDEIYNFLYDINKSMIENINEYQRSTIEFKEFVELWIHEVKIPISSMVLKPEDNTKHELYDYKNKGGNLYLKIIFKILKC